jgi:integrase
MARVTALNFESKRLRDGWHKDKEVRGLYLQVSAEGRARSWVLRYTLNGTTRYMGLGSVANGIGLARARTLAMAARLTLAERKDPLKVRQEQRAAEQAKQVKATTFDQCAAAYIEAHQAGWSNARHREQWTNTIAEYVSPTIGKLAVADIDTALVMKVLQPIWTEMPETASRLRGRIESVLDWAKVQNLRSGENPARWRGHLDNLLPKKSKIAKVANHPSLPYAKLPEFMRGLRKQDSVAARSLEFLILTGARVSEVGDAAWSEFNTAEKVWVIPAERMKAKREHRVPLTPRMIAILDGCDRSSPRPFIFTRAQSAMASAIKRAGDWRDDKGKTITPHGFRSSFSVWAAERTSYPAEVCEAALAHTDGSKVRRAYQRSDLFDLRRRLMADWERYCMEGKPVTTGVVPLRSA